MDDPFHLGEEVPSCLLLHTTNFELGDLCLVRNAARARHILLAAMGNTGLGDGGAGPSNHDTHGLPPLLVLYAGILGKGHVCSAYTGNEPVAYLQEPPMEYFPSATVHNSQEAHSILERHC